MICKDMKDDVFLLLITELQRDILVKEYSKSGVIDFAQVIADSDRDQVIIGAR